LIEHNLVGTINTLELLKQWRCGFTILSTSRVYWIRALGAIPGKTDRGIFSRWLQVWSEEQGAGNRMPRWKPFGPQ